MLNDFNSIIQAARESGKLVAVTHAGIFHADDLSCTVILSLFLEGLGIELVIKRTYEVSQIPEGDNVIVYDMGDGPLDHKPEDPLIDGRKLSSLGKLWRFGKQEFMEKFEISERMWTRIDRDFVAPIDKTDTSSKMNPLTFCINSMRNVMTETDSWDLCFRWLKSLIKSVLDSARIMTSESEELCNSPILTINGKKFRLTDYWCSGFDYRVDGHIWKAEDGTYKIRLFKGAILKKQNIKNGEDKNIIYISPSGRNGQVKTLKDLEDII